VDIQQEMLDLLAKAWRNGKITKTSKGFAGTITDPKLPPAPVDVVLMVDVYHEFDQPHGNGAAICKALKPGRCAWFSSSSGGRSIQ